MTMGNEEFSEALGDVGFPKDINVEISYLGEDTYNKDNSYKGFGELRMKLAFGDETLSYAIHFYMEGTWKLENNAIEYTVSKLEVNPLDDFTKAMFEEDPASFSDFSELINKPVTSNIVKFDGEIIELESIEEGMTLKSTMKKLPSS